MFGNLDNNTILLMVAVVLVFLYFTMDNKESYKSISSKRGKVSSRSAGKVSDKKIGDDAVPVVEGYMNGYY